MCSSKTIKLVANTDKYLLYLIIKVSSQRTPLQSIDWRIFEMWFKMKKSKLEGLRVCYALAGWCGAKLKWCILCISQCRYGSFFWHYWSHCKYPNEITATWWVYLLILMVLLHPNRYLCLSQRNTRTSLWKLKLMKIKCLPQVHTAASQRRNSYSGSSWTTVIIIILNIDIKI